MRIRVFTSLIAAICLVELTIADPAIKPPVSPTPVHSPVAISTVTRPTISPQEWKEDADVREAVLKANPDLVAKARALELKMRAFNLKLTAAMLKEDPRIAPIVNHQELHALPLQTSPKPTPQVSVKVPPTPTPR